ncbi:hypothetical protein SY27_12665 [Flavobacterium sp. 316]|uniref:Signal peptidase n=1 Tax=Flavobacterium sediminilitoris TaxID=2024526 RepID=A0ABY4HR47_9FLAO|nr:MULTISPECIES: hypothetical protein [Flavobacterium]KIX20734.1 hypothetical protein SY27_12665 [Flavobacterium sp. 316]UOX34696.1 hypothetical protein LXD69_04115 [Flavobacterium sediminilitoris]
MKLVINRIVFIVAFLMSFYNGFSQETPPPPTPPPGDPVPIDGGIVLMFFVAILFGYYISRYFYNKKSSI